MSYTVTVYEMQFYEVFISRISLHSSDATGPGVIHQRLNQSIMFIYMIQKQDRPSGWQQYIKFDLSALY
jgi:hypothetical protein